MSYVLHYHTVRAGQKPQAVRTTVDRAQNLEYLILFISRLNQQAFEYGAVYFLT